MPFRIGVIGIDHAHIFGMLGHMKAQGCSCEAFWTGGPAVTEDRFGRTFPEVAKIGERRRILDDPGIALVLIAAVPSDRAALAIEAMEAGKDVMVDKPGCTTLDQLAALRAVQARTGRIWSINFSERFEVPAATRAEELVSGGAIGQVIQTVGLGPHRQNPGTRPPWYFQRARYGGILCDIGSHQIDQFLWFTGSNSACIDHARVRHITMPGQPGFQDYGEMVLSSGKSHGFARVDWFTPDGLPTWGDGRLFIQGTEGFIELRKYTDIGRPHVANTLLLVNGTENALIPCADDPLPYFPRLAADVQDRTQTAAPQAHMFTAMELALRAQAQAEAGAA